MEERTSQVNLRLPVDLVEWIDTYASYLTELNGFNTNRTQAILKLISIARPSEEKLLNRYRQAKDLGFRDVAEFEDWERGVHHIHEYVLSRVTLSEDNKDMWGKVGKKQFYNRFYENSEARSAAITFGNQLRLNFDKFYQPPIGSQMTLLRGAGEVVPQQGDIAFGQQAFNEAMSAVIETVKRSKE